MANTSTNSERAPELKLLESQLDSIASRIYHNRDKIDNIHEQIRVLNEQIKAYRLVENIDCGEFNDTMNEIKKQFTLSEYAHIKIAYKGFPRPDEWARVPKSVSAFDLPSY